MADDLNVKVDANTTGYEAAIARAERATHSFEYALRQAAAADRAQEQALANTHRAMERTGQGLFLFGAAVAAGLGMAANEAIKWETAWTGVTKTVDGSAPQMARLEADLRQLSTTLPSTHEEIAAVAEAAGQLGIKRDAILGFTKTMIDLSETTNLTAEQAATDMARFANIMQTPQDEVDRLGSSIVALGNSSATTEAEILTMATRIAGAGAQLGLTEGEVTGLAAALSSVGINAEAGGSAISQVMKDIALEVSTGGDRLEQFAQVAGMSAEEFKTLWGQDAAAALDAFVTGLGNISASGGDTIKTLSDLEITQIRQSDALLRLAGAGDLLTKSLEQGNVAWEENTALAEEAAKRYETDAAKLEMARNQLRDMAIDAGEVLVPAIAAVVDVTRNMMTAWQDLPGPLKTAAVIIAGVTGAVALFGGAALIAIPKIAAFNAAVAGMNAGALKTIGTRLAGLGGFLMGPWGIALAAGVTALGFFASQHGDAARQVDALKATLDEQTGALTQNSAEWAAKELAESGALSAAKELGIDLGLVTDATLGSADAMAELRDKIWEAREAGKGGPATELIGDVSRLRGVVEDGTAEWQLHGEATAAAGEAQEGTTGAWEEGADAAGELTEEVKTLGEQLSELSEDYLNERDAGIAVRDSLREIKGAVKEYRKEHGDLQGAFKKGTESGDEFAGMLNDLARDYLTQIETTERLTGSQKQTMNAYRDARQSLREVAEQLGMTDRQARDYIDTVLGTPKEARTKFQADTDSALADVRELDRAMEQAARDRTARIGITVQYSGGNVPKGLQEADGGIVETYANGGFSGRFIDRVPQLRQGGGTIVWNEPETGWEAYISGKPGMESRNRAVWSEAGRRLGVGAGGGGGTAVIERVVERLPEGRVVAHIEGIGPAVIRFATQAARSEIRDHDEWAESLQ